MGKIYINGGYREMTAEEQAQFDEMCAEEARRAADEEARKRQEPPTQLETIEAQVMYTALLTDTLIEEV